ncbi:FtsH protease activity modulator HflK [Candidatus Pantoea edessiphila]|uniref:Protein HflK n=1 Tax=Candidatus Pantoea edessiphila TaxID=2044610 RepID=A0A2P5SZQ2_9GAMM|nr:FtsH protease activity modulator HflK [Candidatus Pantoea edessiphila]PPI87811.1 FtsH protease activity modulator HflK [Candidatus Pantoea edessiphila]
MTWNQSGNNNQDRDPWKGEKNNKSNINIFNLGNTFKELVKNIIGLNNNKNNNIKQSDIIANQLIFIMSICVLCIWILSGFYTIKEAECGVLTRFGKFNNIVTPGLNWRLNFIDQVEIINVKKIRELNTSNLMLTSDVNLINTEINLKYVITNPKYYLYSMINIEDSLLKATNSALRSIIGRTNIENILFKNSSIICRDTKHQINKIIHPYNMGINILDVNIKKINIPEEVKTAFESINKAKENRIQLILNAKNYSNKIQMIAKNKAYHIIKKEQIYQENRLLKTTGEIARILKLLPEYKSHPKILRELLYLETIKNILNNTRKILIDSNKHKILFLSESLLNDDLNCINKTKSAEHNIKKLLSTNNTIYHSNKKFHNTENIIEKRKKTCN